MRRRTLLGGALAWSAATIAAPFPLRARGEAPIKLGMVEPLTGAYAKLAAAEVDGARLAIDEVNRTGGILGREVELLVEDSANDADTGVVKTKELIDRDQADFILGNVNSAVALAMARVTNERRKLHIVTGGHTDEITGSRCRWNVFRICKSATMEANAIADTLIEKFGKKWYFLTPDYAYGYALQAAFEQKLRQHGGEWGGDLIPLGTVDYSRFLLNAGSYRPKVLIDIMGGDDQARSLDEIAQFGMSQDMAVGGALFELESILSVSDSARVGWWTMEWWWNQPNVPETVKFVADYRAATKKTPSARDWFGYVSMHTVRLAADKAKSLEGPKLAKALEDFELPPDVALQPGKVRYRAGDHELMPNIFVGEVHPPKAGADDVFTTAALVPGDEAAGSVADTGCKMERPA